MESPEGYYLLIIYHFGDTIQAEDLHQGREESRCEAEKCQGSLQEPDRSSQVGIT